LLCINPFWLWDVGFQLSYIAVLSIVIFMKPIYNLFYFKNKGVNTIWKLNAVTLAAQILTTPVSIYHFHQFPNYFLLTNILAVPLSSLVVLGEIFLCALAFLPVIAKPAGILLHALIWLMNRFIEHMESLPFSLWNGMQVNMLQLIVMYGAVTGMACWLLQKNKAALIAGLGCLLGFISLRTWSFIQAGEQQKLVVYNVPQHQAIDFISGRDYFFKADDELLEDEFLQNFHLKPSRILHRIKNMDSLPSLLYLTGCFLFNNKRIIVIDKSWRYNKLNEKIKADIIILSKNPRISIPDLVNIFDCRQLVLDGSNPSWKLNKWKADCEKLGLACYSVADKGAFVMKMD
jgi:competence protein ComEC